MLHDDNLPAPTGGFIDPPQLFLIQRQQDGNVINVQDRERDTDVYNGLLDSEGEGEGGMIWENGILTCILSCKN